MDDPTVHRHGPSIILCHSFPQPNTPILPKFVAEVTEAVGSREAVGLPLDGPRGADGWRVLDVGCGNGTTMVALARNGFRDIVGTDYSPNSVELVTDFGFTGAKPGSWQLRKTEIMHFWFTRARSGSWQLQ